MSEVPEKEKEQEKKEVSFKEKRIRDIALIYYSRLDVRKAILDFSKNREVVPSYMMEHFGKRPDTLNYESDVLELVKKGATSFHCSEEHWSEPLNLSTGMSEKQLNDLRIGWDLLIDIDSKYFDYSKIYAELLIEVLREHGIKGIGIKFSGSKGLHLIVPWSSFPKEMSGKKTCEMFPEWPRLIIGYLNSKISERLKDRVLDIQEKSDKENQEGTTETYCLKCNNNVEKKSIIYFKCRSCKTQMQNIQDAFAKKRIIRCPNCQIEMSEEKKENVLYCSNCKISSKEDKGNFKERVYSKHIDADLVLVSSRHLFRAPYSLHEKTALASVVLNPNNISKFELKDAHPLKINKPESFIPFSEENEASELLRRALEHSHKFSYENKNEKVIFSSEHSNKSNKSKEFKEVVIKNLSEEMYPPSIKKILEGMKDDGRKRALFILLNFFRSLKVSMEEIEKIITEWNKKNYDPLPQNYIKSQLIWHAKTKPKLPPNFDKPYYKDLGISLTQEELKSKNPVSYTVKKSFQMKRFEK